jgi:8-amino-7-oxononanoate synthase
MRSIASRHNGLADQPIAAVAGPCVRIAGRWVLNFAATNYLGLSGHPLVTSAATRAAREWGLSLATPRVLAVDRLTERLETAIAQLVGQEQALVFPSTTHAALDVLPLLAGSRGALFLDEWAYPLSVAGAFAATRDGAQVRRFPHNDTRTLARLLSARGVAGSVVVCDGVYPATGRPATLRAIERAARMSGALVYVDDAHGIGLLGAHPSATMPYGWGGGGTPMHVGIAPGRIVHVGSLSKALGVPVAFVAGPGGLIAPVRAAPTYTHASPPALPVLGAALAALQVHQHDGDTLRSRLAELVGRFQRGLRDLGWVPFPDTLFPIQALRFSTAQAAYAAARALRRHGIWAILQVGSPEHATGGVLRFALTALHQPEDIDLLIEAIMRHVRPIASGVDS